MLMRIAREVGLVVPATMTVVELLLAIATKVIPDIADEIKLSILRHRVDMDDEALELLMQEGVEEELAEKDLADCNKELNDRSDLKVSIQAEMA
eukprot:1181861-Pyramimonas_sp.AAC.1